MRIRDKNGSVSDLAERLTGSFATWLVADQNGSVPDLMHELTGSFATSTFLAQCCKLVVLIIQVIEE